MARPRTATRTGTRPAASSSRPMVFSRRNYHMLLIGVALVVVGFAIMAIEHELDGFWSRNVAPIIIVAGYLEVIWAILWRPRASKRDQ
ncbi:DUF3098 domain-containing protein [Rhodothermus marinus]|nr:DUF3098 domain-containing protein [Rhodothermus marinus]